MFVNRIYPEIWSLQVLESPGEQFLLSV